jgi:hypothetical protein
MLSFQKLSFKLRKNNMSTKTEVFSSSKLCDWQSPEIGKKAEEIAGSAPTDEEKARRISLWIKQNVKYALGHGAYWNAKASDTLKLRKGMCFNVTNLQIALLRSLGIPCRYGVVLIKKESAKHRIPAWRYKKMSQTTEHIFGEIYIQGKWRRFDIERNEDFDGQDKWKRYDLPETKYSKAILDDLALKKAKKDTHEERDRIDDHFQLLNRKNLLFKIGSQKRICPRAGVPFLEKYEYI